MPQKKSPLRVTRKASRPRKKSTRRKRKGSPFWKTCLLIAIIVTLITLVGVGLSSGQKGHTGIDVSRWQGKIDWTEVASEGDIEYVFAKATQGKSAKDPTFQANRDSVRSHGIPFGAYHFFESKVDGAKQFQNFVSVVGKNIDLRPVLDLEDMGGEITDEDQYKQEVSAFIEACHDYYGSYPIVYAGSAFVKDHHLQETISRCPHWMPWYTRMPRPIISRRRYFLMTHPGSQAIMWQYTQTGTHRGINEKIDIDECWEMPTIML